MAHKSMIGGAVYEVGGGKSLVSGAVHEIDHGKTMLGGAVCEVGFGPAMAIVRLTSDTFEDRNYCSTYIYYTTPDGGTGYLSSAGTYSFPIGTMITCLLDFGGKGGASLSLYFNGSMIKFSNEYINYTFEITQNIAIMPVNKYYSGGWIHVSEIPENAVVFSLNDGEFLYGAESGATWEEFVYSDYNFADEYGAKISISGDSVVNRYNIAIKYNDYSTIVKPSDKIIDGETYYAR